MVEKVKQQIVFIHGFRGNHLGLETLAKKYFAGKKYDVYVPDIPPAGGNTMREFSARYSARFIADYIKANKLEKPILVGHSMGSIVTAAVAERYPELIADKIVFLAPISVRTSGFVGALAPLAALLPSKVVSKVTTRYMYIKASGADYPEILETSTICGADYTSRGDLYSSARFSTTYALEDFEFKKKPIFIAGEHDRLMPREKTEEVAAKFGAKAVFIKDAGHLLNYEQPGKVAAAIKRFLRED